MLHCCRADMPLISSHALSLEYPVSPGDACVGGGPTGWQFVAIHPGLTRLSPNLAIVAKY
jgi:hypothetical protein